MVGEFLQKGPHIIDTARHSYDSRRPLLRVRFLDDGRSGCTPAPAATSPYRNDHDVFTCGAKLDGGAERASASPPARLRCSARPASRTSATCTSSSRSNVEMGPFVTVPRTGPSLTVSYAGLNYGSSDSNAVRAVMPNGASTITSAHLRQAVYPVVRRRAQGGRLDHPAAQRSDRAGLQRPRLRRHCHLGARPILDSLTQANGSATPRAPGRHRSAAARARRTSRRPGPAARIRSATSRRSSAACRGARATAWW